MENTGRIHSTLTPGAQRIIFAQMSDDERVSELIHVTEVDRGHLLMLAEMGIVDLQSACRLLRAIHELRSSRFDELRGMAAPRGLYLLYENFLISNFGHNIGGILQTGRSRNDLNATVFRLGLRGAYLKLLSEALRLQATLIRRGRKHIDDVMPAYTHFQAAVPITYGHFLAGVASALARDIQGVIEASADIDRSPLGAGAVGGTSHRIDPQRTASLLGFDRSTLSSIDAVASRDLALRLLAAIAVLGVTLSRLATDLLTWST